MRHRARRGSVVVVVVWAVAIAAVLVAATQIVTFRQAVVGRETLARVQARWAARAGVEPKAAEQLWGLLVAGDGGGGFGVAPQPPRVQIEGADAENKDEDI